MENEEISIFPERMVEYGTFGQRFGAYLLDVLILLIPAQIIIRTSGHGFYDSLLFKHEFDSTGFLIQLLITAMNWLYFSLMESGSAQATIGKQALGLKVTDLYGNRISFAIATGRYFGKIISGLIILIGYFMMLWDDKNQTLHDKMAGTLVVKK